MKTKNNALKSIRDAVIFAMLGSLMFCTKVAMEGLPNIHPLAMLTVVYTIVYRKKALIPIYIYVFMNGLYAGFNLWWLPYLYIWTILWAVTMLLPERIPEKIKMFLYPALCALHGLAYGMLYAPAQAIMYGFSFKAALSWIAGGLLFDLVHAAGNLAMGVLILPLSKLLSKLERNNR